MLIFENHHEHKLEDYCNEQYLAVPYDLSNKDRNGVGKQSKLPFCFEV